MNLPVQEDSTQALVKVLEKPREHLFEDAGLGASRSALGELIALVILQDLLNWVSSRKWNELLVLGDVLPVVDEDRLDAIWDRQADRWAVKESVLLYIKTELESNQSVW